MKTTDDLFQLIKSLSKSEKIYFKRVYKSYSTKEENKYALLFDLIDRQKIYDEKALLEKLSKKYTNVQISFEKNYLYNTILKILEPYYEEDELKVRSKLNHIYMLYSKGLLSQADKLIKQAKKIADKHEFSLLRADLLKWEYEIQRRQQLARPDDLAYFYSEQKKILSEYLTGMEYFCLRERISLEIKENGAKNSLAYLESLLNEDLLKPENEPTHTFGLINFYYCQSLLNFFFRKDREAHHYIKKILGLMEKTPGLLQRRPDMYIYALRNMVIAQINLYKFGEAFKTLGTLNKVGSSSANISNLKKQFITELTLEILYKSGEFKKAVSYIEENEIADKLSSYNTVGKSFLYHQLSYCYFGVGNYRLANFYLNELFNSSIELFHNDLICYASLMKLIIQYEMGRVDLIEYTVKSTNHFIQNKKRLYNFEKVLLDFIRKKLIPEVSVNEFKVLRDSLGALKMDPVEKKAFEYFDFISWAESKIQKRPFATIIREKTGRQ